MAGELLSEDRDSSAPIQEHNGKRERSYNKPQGENKSGKIEPRLSVGKTLGKVLARTRVSSSSVAKAAEHEVLRAIIYAQIVADSM